MVGLCFTVEPTDGIHLPCLSCPSLSLSLSLFLSLETHSLYARTHTRVHTYSDTPHTERGAHKQTRTFPRISDQ